MQNENMNGGNELLTGEELCHRLKISKSFLYAPVRRKGNDPIPCVKVAKHLRYRLPEVMAWIERHQKEQLSQTDLPRKEFTDDQLLRLPQVLEIIPVSKSHWYAGIKAGKYPTGFLLSERVRVWPYGNDIKPLLTTNKNGVPSL